jgi:hypothetical protein
MVTIPRLFCAACLAEATAGHPNLSPIANVLSSQGGGDGCPDVMQELRRVRNAADAGLSAYNLHVSWLADGRMNTLHLDLSNKRVVTPLLGLPTHVLVNEGHRIAPYDSNVLLCAEDSARACEHQRLYEQVSARSV